MNLDYAIEVLRDKKRAHNYSIKEWKRMKTCYDNLARNKFFVEDEIRVKELQLAISILQKAVII